MVLSRLCVNKLSVPVERPVLTHGAIKYLKIILHFIIKLSEYLTPLLFFFPVTNRFFLYVSLLRYHFADNLIFYAHFQYLFLLGFLLFSPTSLSFSICCSLSLKFVYIIHYCYIFFIKLMTGFTVKRDVS
jgi:hypothetical protein